MRATRDYRSQLEQVVLLSHYCTLSADELRLSGTKTENYQPNYQAIHSAGARDFCALVGMIVPVGVYSRGFLLSGVLGVKGVTGVGWRLMRQIASS